jgi:glyoxylase I family protein
MTTAPSFTNLDHVTIVITDWPRAVAFYRDVLGMREVAIPTTFPGAGLPVRWFQIGSQFIHLYKSDAADPPSPRHFAIHVGDIGAARDYFAGKDVATSETVKIPGADRFFISDPDGNRIEVIHWEHQYEIRPV